MPPLAHWDEVEPRRREFGHICASWANLGSAAGSIWIGLQRIKIDPGKWSTPAHVECGEEEIFYVLDGSGISWQQGKTYEVGPGDCLVHLVEDETHTLRAGPDGLDVLAFGMRVPTAGTYLPRAGVYWQGPGFVLAGTGKHPFQREADAGEPEVEAPSPWPSRIVSTRQVEPIEWGNDGDVRSTRRNLGQAAGSVLTGMQHFTIAPGKLGTAPHCHAAEEEIFVVLEGDGTLLLGDEEHPVRPGSIVARPPATRIAHAFRAGEVDLVLLAYGTREPSDVVYYPRSRKIFFRGVGVMARLDPSLDYWDGEP